LFIDNARSAKIVNNVKLPTRAEADAIRANMTLARKRELTGQYLRWPLGRADDAGRAEHEHA
jgi:hypothetical protein